MGYPIYVMKWVLKDIMRPAEGYHYEEVYGGCNWFKAIRAAIKAKRQGAGCVRIEWR